MTPLHCTLSDGLASLCDVPVLWSHLSKRGVRIADGGVPVVTSTDRPPDHPHIVIHSDLRVSEMRDGEEQSLTRLMDSYGATMDEETVSALWTSSQDTDRTGYGATSRDHARRCQAVEALFARASDEEALADIIARAIQHLRPAAETRVSVIINNYNYADYLNAAIDSALAQNVPAHEVIVVDDGSTDGSRGIIESYSQIIPVLKPNGGQGSAFNAGVAAASGDVIMFLDADDILYPDAVAAVAAQRFDRIARLSFGLDLINGQGTPCGVYPTTLTAKDGHLKGLLMEQGFFHIMPTSGNAFPRWVLEAIGPVPEADWRISADLYLTFAAALHGPARHLDHVAGAYRVHGSNAYFRDFGADPYWNDRKFEQRRRAWVSLAKQTRSQRDSRRLSLLAARERGGVTGLAARAKLALDRLSLTPPRHNTRLAHTDMGARLSLRARALLAETDLSYFGGRCTWPELSPGASLELNQSPGALGHGWTHTKLSQPTATLGVVVPGPRRSWMLRLHLQGTDDMSGEVDIWCNGRRLDAQRVSWETVEIRIPGPLFDYAQDVGGYAVRICLLFPKPAVSQLSASRLTAVAMPETGLTAPRLPLDQTVTDLSPYMGSGWSWPTDTGMTLLSDEANLAFSVTSREHKTLTLVFSGTAPMVSIADAMATPHTDGRTLSVNVPFSAADDEGVVRVSLFSPGGGTTRLQSLRLSNAYDALWSLDARALEAWIDDPVRWHSADDTALWLAQSEGSLSLPPPPPTSTGVSLRVLTLNEPHQNLTVALEGGEPAVHTGGGLANIHLPLPNGPARLHLSTDTLVDMSTLGMGEDGALGGALCSVHYTTTEAHNEP